MTISRKNVVSVLSLNHATHTQKKRLETAQILISNFTLHPDLTEFINIFYYYFYFPFPLLKDPQDANKQ